MRVIRHRPTTRIISPITLTVFMLLPAMQAQQNQPTMVPQSDTCTLDADGTAHITRVVPLPATISPEAQKFISRQVSSGPDLSMAERRAMADTFRKARTEAARKLYPVNIAEKMFGGVRCDVITPFAIPPEKQNRVLINVHGGGFNSDWGSLVEGIPIAYLARTTVVSVYYRLAPEYPYPAAVDDTEAVYKELLKTYKPQNMGLYGTSAGAVLTVETAVRLRQDGLPLPGVLGFFSGTGDLDQVGDTQAIYSVSGLGGSFKSTKGHLSTEYAEGADPKDPVFAPLHADLHGFPPTLFVSSTRDVMLSGTAILHRAFLRADVDGQLVVFEALPHAFWNDFSLPESKEAHEIMAKFFDQQLSKGRSY